MSEERDFDSKAAEWDREERRVKLAHDVAEGILKVAGPMSHMKVLDFGCGTGLLTLFLQPHVLSIDGVDTSKGMLDVLSKKVEGQGIKNVRALKCDLLQGEFTGELYGLIATNMTLHHIMDIGSVIGIFFRLLVPGGMVCIADLDKEDGTFHDDSTGIRHTGLDRSVVMAAMKKAGFFNIRDTTVSTVRKARPSGEKSYPVFLITGWKRSDPQ